MQLLSLWPYAIFSSTILGQHMDFDAGYDDPKTGIDLAYLLDDKDFWDDSEHESFEVISKFDDEGSMLMSRRGLFGSDNGFLMLYTRAPSGTPSRSSRDKSSPGSISKERPPGTESSQPKLSGSKSLGLISSGSKSSGTILNKNQQLRAKPVPKSRDELGDVILSGQVGSHQVAHHDTFRAIRMAHEYGREADLSHSSALNAEAQGHRRNAKKLREKNKDMRSLQSQKVDQALKHYDTAHTAMIAHAKLREAGWKYSQGLTSKEKDKQGEPKHERS